MIQTATLSQDPTTRQEVENWNAGQIVAAEWLPSTARETWTARQIDATIEGIYATYDLHPRPAPDTTRIVGEDGRLFDLVGVTEIGRGRGLLLAVKARGEAL